MNLMKEQFTMRKTIKRGYILLYALILIFLVILPQVSVVLFPADEIVVYLNAVDNEVTETEKENQVSPELLLNESIEINSVTEEKLVEIGLESRIARRWKHFGEVIEGYTSVEEIKKIYGLQREVYEQLKPCLYVENSGNKLDDRKPSGTAAAEKAQRNFMNAQKGIEMEAFNPNEVGEVELMQMGLSPQTASTWVNYRKAIGKFDSLPQLSKIYGLSKGWLEKAEEYMHFPTENRNDNLEDTEAGILETAMTSMDHSIEINSAEVEDWVEFPEIDKKLAERIVKYRYFLGGFSGMEDLTQVYGLPDGFVEKYKKFLTKDKRVARSVNINTASTEELQKNLQISKNQAKNIVNYRNQHGPFGKVSDLQRIRTLSPSVLSEIEGAIVLE